MNARARSFWREEIALAALLLAFFAGIVCFALPLPFDARLFPLVIGGAGILLTLAIAAVELRRPLAGSMFKTQVNRDTGQRRKQTVQRQDDKGRFCSVEAKCAEDHGKQIWKQWRHKSCRAS